nr:unnamed protein product [uncultured bacterium]
MDSFKDFFKNLNKWQKLTFVICLFAFSVAALLLTESCSGTRFGYTRHRDIFQSDSTYIVYSQTLTKSYTYGR